MILELWFGCANCCWYVVSPKLALPHVSVEFLSLCILQWSVLDFICFCTTFCTVECKRQMAFRSRHRLSVIGLVCNVVVQGKWCNTCGRNGSWQNDSDDCVSCDSDECPRCVRSVFVACPAVNTGDVAARVSSVGATGQRRRIHRRCHQSQHGTMNLKWIGSRALSSFCLTTMGSLWMTMDSSSAYMGSAID